MPIHFRCPNCAKLLALGTRRGGTQIHCPMCDRIITVPPRTEVQVPTTTVVLPDLPENWWMDAPPELPPQLEPPAAADAWWLNANAPPILPDNTISPNPPSSPPPLPEALPSPPAAQPTEANNTIASTSYFPHWLLFLLAVGVVLAAIAAILLLIAG